jgi:hypothetical protein
MSCRVYLAHGVPDKISLAINWIDSETALLTGLLHQNWAFAPQYARHKCGFFDRFDLAAREDLEVQRKLLERAHAKLAALEARVAELEARKP